GGRGDGLIGRRARLADRVAGNLARQARAEDDLARDVRRLDRGDDVAEDDFLHGAGVDAGAGHELADGELAEVERAEARVVRAGFCEWGADAADDRDARGVLPHSGASLAQPPPFRGFLDERGQASLARLLFLPLHHEIGQLAAVSRRLRAPEFPRFLVRAKALLVLRRELARAVFVRIDGRLLLVARLEGAQSRRRHASKLRQLAGTLNVDHAPDAAA